MKTPLLKMLGLALAGLLLNTLPAKATQAITDVTDELGMLGALYSQGWQFYAFTDLRVTALEAWYFDMGGETTWGADGKVTITLWNNGVALASADILPTSTVAFSSGGGSYLKVNLTTPVTLSANSEYIITAKYTGSSSAILTYTVPTASKGTIPTGDTVENEFNITNGAKWLGSDYAALSDDIGTNIIYQTANFEYTAVPEPSTYALLGTGLLALGFLRRKLAAKAA